jgi:RNA polymerase sigma-70 factor (sigma-E family)
MVVERDVGDEALERLVAVRGEHLLRTAVLLAGGREAGEDLFQATLERVLPRWRSLEGDPEGYLRRTMANLAVDAHRRHGRWVRALPLLRAERESAPDPMSAVDLRDALVRALVQLPPRQRIVLVLRYWEQMSDAEAAGELGWPEGTVKSATARGLRRLREIATAWNDVQEATR